MTRAQLKIVNDLRTSFENATIEVVDHSEFTGKVKVFMVTAPRTCRGDYLRNHFEIGPRGGLKVVKQEFDGNY